jgi:hypothetical protein
LVPPTASVSLDGITSGDEDALATDAVWMLPNATPADEGALGYREDALLGPNTATSNPSIHLPPYKKHSDDAPIPLDLCFAFHNTMEMLPPATGPPVPQALVVPGIIHLGDPLSATVIKSHHHSSDHGESQPTLVNLLPFDYGENQLTVDYGECLPAIKAHSKDLDNDGEITTKLISTITTGEPLTDALLLYGKDSQQSHACIIQANECFHAHVSQVIGIHDKDLDNDGEITTKLISTITTNNPITNTLINHIYSSSTSRCGTNHPGCPIHAQNYHGILTTYLHKFGSTNSVHKMTGANFPTNMDLLDHNDTDATLLPTYKHGDSFED